MLGWRWRQSRGRDIEWTRGPVGCSLGEGDWWDATGCVWVIVVGMRRWDADGDDR
jgi:hypothetical protein